MSDGAAQPMPKTIKESVSKLRSTGVLQMSEARALCDYLERRKADSDLLDELGWDGCLTGDCPHETQSQCDKHLADQLREVIGRRDG